MSNTKHLAVIFSDWHIHNYQQFNNDNQRLDYCIKVLFDIGEFCDKHGIKTILFGGDLYDTQKALLTLVVNKTVEAFKNFSDVYPDIEIIAISGNHDFATKNTMAKPAVTALSHISDVCPNFHIIDRSVRKIETVSVYGIPYFEYQEDFDAALDKTAYDAKHTAGNKILLIHQTPRMENSMIPHDTTAKDPRYAAFDHVFCGHIHSRMDLTDRFTLVGNPIHRDLADAGKKKGFLVMNLMKPEKGYKFIPLKGYPEFMEITEGEDMPEGSESNYVVVRPSMDEAKLSSEANVEDFNSSVSSEDLMRNFWEEAEGKDEELLKVGLSFIK